MLFIFFKGLLLATLAKRINCSYSTDLAAWTERDTRPESYFSAPTPNFLRCGKLCERQGECHGASFDIVQRICHLHDKSVIQWPADIPGKYMFRDVQKESENINTRGECKDTQISLPREGDSEGCRDIHAEDVLLDIEQPTSSTTVSSPTKITTSTEQPSISTTVSSATDVGTTAEQSAASTMEPSVAATHETTSVEETSTIATESTPETTSIKETSTIATKSVIQCQNNQTYDGSTCVCVPPLTGKFCENGPRDCHGHTAYNWTNIYPEDGKGKIRVLCGTNYLYASVAPEFGFASENLNRTWLDYKVGFGDIKDQYNTVGGYWLGNDNIHRITSGTLSYKLTFYAITYSDRKSVGDYLNFQLSSETEHYTETYTSFYSATSMEQVLEKDRPFITFDRDENGCAGKKNTGFWFDEDCQIQPPLFGNVKVAGIDKTYYNFWISLIRM